MTVWVGDVCVIISNFTVFVFGVAVVTAMILCEATCEVIKRRMR